MPLLVVMFVYNGLVDAVRPGERVKVTGIFQAIARRVTPKIRRLKSVYRKYVVVIHFKRSYTALIREFTCLAVRSSTTTTLLHHIVNNNVNPFDQ